MTRYLHTRNKQAAAVSTAGSWHLPDDSTAASPVTGVFSAPPAPRHPTEYTPFRKGSVMSVPRRNTAMPTTRRDGRGVPPLSDSTAPPAGTGKRGAPREVYVPLAVAEALGLRLPPLPSASTEAGQA